MYGKKTSFPLVQGKLVYDAMGEPSWTAGHLSGLALSGWHCCLSSPGAGGVDTEGGQEATPTLALGPVENRSFSGKLDTGQRPGPLWGMEALGWVNRRQMTFLPLPFADPARRQWGEEDTEGGRKEGKSEWVGGARRGQAQVFEGKNWEGPRGEDSGSCV